MTRPLLLKAEVVEGATQVVDRVQNHPGLTLNDSVPSSAIGRIIRCPLHSVDGTTVFITGRRSSIIQLPSGLLGRLALGVLGLASGGWR